MLTAGPTESQASPPARRSRLLVMLGSTIFVVVATVAQLLRQSGAHMWRTVWAEDGALFYTEALQEPLRDIVFRPYAGYSLVVPRVLASIGVHLPLEWYSHFAAVSASLLAALLALFVYFGSAPLLRSPIRQAVFAGALLFWPVLPFEISGVIANTHWVMAVPCLLAVLLPVDRPTAIAVRVVIVSLAPLSGPLCVLFMPIASWHIVRAVVRRAGFARLIVPVVYLLSSFVQVMIWLTADQGSRTTPSAGSFLADVTKLYSTRVSTEFLFGVRVTESLWDGLGYWIAVGSLVALATALGWKWRRATWTSRWFMGSCVVASAAIYAVSLSQRTDFISSMVLVNGNPYNFLGMRYQLFPAALLLLALLVPVDLPRGAILDTPSPQPCAHLTDDLQREKWVIAVAALWLLVAFVPSYRLTTARSAGPDWGTGLGEAEGACVASRQAEEIVPISPAPVWMIAVPCSELVG